jgi:2-(1,2-epoxy-1,2-dihydrophenyl)acetyl-CoA isomerase
VTRLRRSDRLGEDDGGVSTGDGRPEPERLGEGARNGESFAQRSPSIANTSVNCEFRSGAAWITLGAVGGGNTVTLESTFQLLTAIRQARSAGARVVVLQAHGDAFSVGGDLRVFGRSSDVGLYVDDLAEALHRVISELTRLDAVVVAAVQGVAAGAGVALAAAADIIVAGASATFIWHTQM